MAISFTGTGGLFTRLKLIYTLLRDALAYESDTQFTLALPSIQALGVQYANVLAQYLSNERELVDGLAGQRDAARNSLSGWKQFLVELAGDTLVEQVDRDVTLVEKTVAAAWAEALKQMAGGGSIPAGTATYDVDASTVSVTCAAVSTMLGANVGNAVLVGSVKRPDGRNNELVFAETIEVECESDDQTSGVGRAESWVVTGELAQDDPLHFEWPDGSGAGATLTTVDASQDNSGGNLLANSDFEDFTSNVPDQWLLLAGTAGTQIFSEVSTIYGTHGAKSLELTGNTAADAVAKVSLTQAFDDESNGTGATLLPNTVYHVNFFARKSASLAAGVVRFRLIDGSNAAINDDTGTAVAFTVAHSALSSSDWTAVSGTFVTPRTLPVSGQKFNIEVTTALTNGESIFIDDLAMCVAAEAYTGGPHLSIFAGSTNPVVGDKHTATVANNYAGQVQLDTDRVFGLKALGLQLPSDTAGTEAIVDLVLPTYLHQAVGVVATIDPFNGNNATTLSDAIDMSLWSQVMFVLSIGANDSTVDFKVTESATSGGSYTDIAGKAITQETGGDDDNKQWIISVKASEMGSGMGFLKASVTIGNGTTNLISLVAMGVAVTPAATDNDLSSVAQVIA